MPYHVFCRRSYTQICKSPVSRLEIQWGLRVLESILFFGLLLRPEKSQGIGGRTSRPRICFSELLLAEMQEKVVPIDNMRANHFDVFGPFAIGISSQSLREMGAMAVLSRASASAMGATFSDVFLEAINCVQTITTALAHLETRAHPDHDFFQRIGHALAQEDLAAQGITVANHDVQQRIVSLVGRAASDEAAYIEGLFEEIDPERLPFWQISQRLNWFLDFVQEADSSKQRRELAYYRQREWRVVHAFRPGLTFIPLSRAQLARAVFEDYRDHAEEFLAFWDNAEFSDCWLLAGLSGEPISRYITEVVCPASAVEHVERLLETADVSHIEVRIV